MTELAYYPGCSLQSMSWDYRESIKHVTAALDVHLTEIKDWTCCGATAAHSLDEKMSVIMPAWNLAGAQALGRDLAVACPMCFRRLSHCRNMILEKRAEVPWSLDPNLAIVDLARYLATDAMIERIRERVLLPLDGLRVVCYYGCQVVRPPKITGFNDYENPQHLDRLAAAVGATPIDWSFKATCCGASMGIPKREIGLSLVKKLLSWAEAAGAQAVIVCCPLCQGNLDIHQVELCRESGADLSTAGMPILYYTELLGIAFGLDPIRTGLRSHLVDPLPMIGRILDRQGSCS